MDITIGNRSQSTGRFNFKIGTDGDVAFDDTEAHAMMMSVVDHKEEYWADENQGSFVFKIKTLTSRAPSQAEAYARDGVNSMEQSGLVSSVVAKSAVKRRGILSLDLSWTSGANSHTVEI